MVAITAQIGYVPCNLSNTAEFDFWQTDKSEILPLYCYDKYGRSPGTGLSQVRSYLFTEPSRFLNSVDAFCLHQMVDSERLSFNRGAGRTASEFQVALGFEYPMDRLTRVAFRS